MANARKIVRAAILAIPADTSAWPARTALTGAIMTAPEAISDEAKQRLALLIGRSMG